MNRATAAVNITQAPEEAAMVLALRIRAENKVRKVKNFHAYRSVYGAHRFASAVRGKPLWLLPVYQDSDGIENRFGR